MKKVNWFKQIWFIMAFIVFALYISKVLDKEDVTVILAFCIVNIAYNTKGENER